MRQRGHVARGHLWHDTTKFRGCCYTISTRQRGGWSDVKTGRWHLNRKKGGGRWEDRSEHQQDTISHPPLIWGEESFSLRVVYHSRARATAHRRLSLKVRTWIHFHITCNISHHFTCMEAVAATKVNDSEMLWTPHRDESVRSIKIWVKSESTPPQSRAITLADLSLDLKKLIL